MLHFQVMITPDKSITQDIWMSLLLLPMGRVLKKHFCLQGDLNMKNWLRKLRKDERGLTLVELLAVIVILAIVAAIAFVAIGNVIENSKKDAHVANALQVISAAKLYEAAGGDASTVSTETLKTEGYLDELIDPWTKEPEGYTGTVTKSGDDYEVELSASNTEYNINHTESELIQKGRKIFDSAVEDEVKDD